MGLKPHHSVVDRWQTWLDRWWPSPEAMVRTLLWRMYCDAVMLGRMLEREGMPMPGPKNETRDDDGR